MKYAFLFHFIIGALVYSNDKILTSSDDRPDLGGEQFDTDGNFIDKAGSWIQSHWFSARWNSAHILIFIIGNIGIMLVMVFKATCLKWYSDSCKKKESKANMHKLYRNR